MFNHSIKRVTEADIINANPWFFWEPMTKAMGTNKGELKIKNGTLYYFVKYEAHTTVYDVDTRTLELRYRSHLG